MVSVSLGITRDDASDEAMAPAEGMVELVDDDDDDDVEEVDMFWGCRVVRRELVSRLSGDWEPDMGEWDRSLSLMVG